MTFVYNYNEVEAYDVCLDVIDTYDRFATMAAMSTEIEEVTKEVVNLREHGESLGDAQIIGSASRVLALLSHMGREQRGVSAPGLVSIGQAVKLSGKSRNTIKGWVKRSLLDGYQGRTNNELFVPRDQLLHLLDLAPIRTLSRFAAGSRRNTVRHSIAKRHVSRHRLAELRSLAMHKRVAELIEDDPSLLEKARSRVGRWLDGSEYSAASPAYSLRWRELLAGPQQRLINVLTSDDDESRDLRQSSPFAGFLSERERRAIMDAVAAKVG